MSTLLQSLDTAPIPVFAAALVLAALAALGFMALPVLGARKSGAVVDVTSEQTSEHGRDC